LFHALCKACRRFSFLGFLCLHFRRLAVAFLLRRMRIRDGDKCLTCPLSLTLHKGECTRERCPFCQLPLTVVLIREDEALLLKSPETIRKGTAISTLTVTIHFIARQQPANDVQLAPTCVAVPI
uniref:Zf-C3HC4 domain-containing protein n=1 Tax=Angiostrongylus cantonensis TaxID=6313 RepID=A0A0K0DR18_ANGCA